MNAHESCYGKIFPPVKTLAHNKEVVGKVFSYRIQHDGMIADTPAMRVNRDAWENCTTCKDFDGCYRLSVATILMDMSLTTR